MTSLKQFRDHCRTMATVEHKPGCEERQRKARSDRSFARLFGEPPPEPVPPCDGCNPDADRALFAQMAGEIDDYLAPQTDLFGELHPEPTTSDTDQLEATA